MRYYSIFFSENGHDNWMPLYEGRRDGRYWLGGTARFMFPLIFSSKKLAEEALKRVLLVEFEQADEPRGIFTRGKIMVRRCELVSL